MPSNLLSDPILKSCQHTQSRPPTVADLEIKLAHGRGGGWSGAAPRRRRGGAQKTPRVHGLPESYEDTRNYWLLLTNNRTEDKGE